MTTPSPPTVASRRLLVNGEALRVEVTAPRGAGGEKYEPQSAEEARELLEPQLRAVISTTSRLHSTLRASRHVYVEARLLPNYIAAGQHPGALLAQIGAVPVGSRADKSLYRTRTREVETGTRRLILAVTDQGLVTLSDLVASGGRTRSERTAFEEIRKFDELAVAGPDSIIRSRPKEAMQLITWEAVLHPAAVMGQDPAPLDEETLSKWFSLVQSAGGQVHEAFIRTVGGLTFTPVSMASDAATHVAQFNPLRAIRPMPSIRPRPRFGTRAVARLQPPANPSPSQDEPVIAVFGLP